MSDMAVRSAAIPDPVALAQDLIRRPSVTPADAGALDRLEAVLKPLGFRTFRLTFEEAGSPAIDNLYARIGTEAPHFSFAGHTDVVPPGDLEAWASNPFAAEIRSGRLFGRGAADMKGAIAAFVSGAAAHLEKLPLKGSISLLITGDEEGPAVNGTVKMLRWLKERGETIDHCLVGEPTSQSRLGDMVKIGRRASLNIEITALGTQGHVAYPDRADNPLPRLIALLSQLAKLEIDQGTEHFQPSHLEIVTIDTGNSATNVIPARATARLNIRFNDRHTQASIRKLMEAEIERFRQSEGGRFEVRFSGNGEPFLTSPGDFTRSLQEAIRAETGLEAELSTSGGTSDARFITAYAPVVEFGLVGDSMHKVDENVPVEDVRRLARIYEKLLDRYFSAP